MANKQQTFFRECATLFRSGWWYMAPSWSSSIYDNVPLIDSCRHLNQFQLMAPLNVHHEHLSVKWNNWHHDDDQQHQTKSMINSNNKSRTVDMTASHQHQQQQQQPNDRSNRLRSRTHDDGYHNQNNELIESVKQFSHFKQQQQQHHHQPQQTSNISLLSKESFWHQQHQSTQSQMKDRFIDLQQMLRFVLEEQLNRTERIRRKHRKHHHQQQQQQFSLPDTAMVNNDDDYNTINDDDNNNDDDNDDENDNKINRLIPTSSISTNSLDSLR